MNKFVGALRRNRDEVGASAVEYGLLVAAIAAVIVIIAFALGGTVRGLFKNTCDTIASNDSNASVTSCSS